MEEMKYKTGDKFIVEISDVNCKKSELYPYRLELGLGVWEKEKNLDALEKYEPHNTAEDAWKILREIANLNPNEMEEYFHTEDVRIVLRNYPYTEAKDIYKEWKDDQEIKVGDEVVYQNNFHTRYIVTRIFDDGYFQVWNDILFAGCFSNKDDIKKTGRHFDLTALMDFMKGESE